MTGDIADHARATLERQVRQLEQWEPHLSAQWWAEAAYEQTAFEKAVASGLVHLRQALNDARRALASDDPETIVLTAISCGTLILDGFSLALRDEIRTRRAVGGKARGRQRTTEAQQQYAQWVPKWEKLLAGKTPAKARAIIQEEMENAGVG